MAELDQTSHGSPFDLHGRVSLVTGASSGIGADIARALGEAGSDVVLVGRSPERLADAARLVEKAGVGAETVVADLLSEDAPAQVVAAALAAFGRIDVLVHSAGIYLQGSIEGADDAVLDDQWAINVRAPYRLTQAVLPHLGDGSSVIWISSMSGHIGSAKDTAYCATKGAVELLVKSMASELAPRGIRVNAVAPGNVHTPMNAELITPELEREILAMTPAGRIGVVTDVSPAVVFLASAAGAYVHGASILIDGGVAAQ